MSVKENNTINPGIYSDFVEKNLLNKFTVESIQVELDTKSHIDAEGAEVAQVQEVCCYRSVKLPNSIPTRIYIPVEYLGLYFDQADVIINSAASIGKKCSKETTSKPIPYLCVQTDSGDIALFFSERRVTKAEHQTLRAGAYTRQEQLDSSTTEVDHLIITCT